MTAWSCVTSVQAGYGVQAKISGDHHAKIKLNLAQGVKIQRKHHKVKMEAGYKSKLKAIVHEQQAVSNLPTTHGDACKLPLMLPSLALELFRKGGTEAKGHHLLHL